MHDNVRIEVEKTKQIDKYILYITVELPQRKRGDDDKIVVWVHEIDQIVPFGFGRVKGTDMRNFTSAEKLRQVFVYEKPIEKKKKKFNTPSKVDELEIAAKNSSEDSDM